MHRNADTMCQLCHCLSTRYARESSQSTIVTSAVHTIVLACHIGNECDATKKAESVVGGVYTAEGAAGLLEALSRPHTLSNCSSRVVPA